MNGVICAVVGHKPMHSRPMQVLSVKGASRGYAGVDYCKRCGSVFARLADFSLDDTTAPHDAVMGGSIFTGPTPLKPQLDANAF